MRRVVVAICLCFITTWPTWASSEDNWTHWRGPRMDGVAHNSKPPIEWSETKNVHAAREFAELVADLDEDSGELVEQSMWAAEGKGKFAHFHVVRDAGKLADRVAGGCRHWIERNSQPGPKTVGAMNGLIGDLGQAYLTAFGERPSASPNGVFAKSLTEICRAAALPVRFSEPDQKPSRDDTDDAVEVIGKTRLERIIKSRVIGGTQPRRGRKRQN